MPLVHRYKQDSGASQADQDNRQTPESLPTASGKADIPSWITHQPGANFDCGVKLQGIFSGLDSANWEGGFSSQLTCSGDSCDVEQTCDVDTEEAYTIVGRLEVDSLEILNGDNGFTQIDRLSINVNYASPNQ